jgi:hypothetical protein
MIMIELFRIFYVLKMHLDIYIFQFFLYYDDIKKLTTNKKDQSIFYKFIQL